MGAAPTGTGTANWSRAAGPGRHEAQHEAAVYGRSRLSGHRKVREWPVFADLANAPLGVAGYFDHYHEWRSSSIDYQTRCLVHQ